MKSPIPFSKFNLWFAAAATALAAAQPCLAESHIPSPSLDETPQIGQGYSPITERFVGSCINTQGRLRYSGAPGGSIVMSRISSSEQLAKSLGFSMNSKARFGLVTAKLSAEFLSESTSNSYSDAVTFENAIGLKQVNLVVPDEPKVFLTQAAQDDLRVGRIFRHSTLPALTERFQTACGDEFVRSITRGAKLYITVKIEFASAFDKEQFGADLNVSGAFNELSAKLKQASQKLKTSASITVSAFQLGGDPTELGQIISPDADSKHDGDQVNAFLRCSLSNVDACTQFLDGVIRYATSNEPGAFRTQISENYDPNDAKNGAADLEYVTAPWSDLHLVARNNVIDGDLYRLRKELGGIFERELEHNNRILELLSGKFKMSHERETKLFAAQKTVNENFDEISDTAKICYREDGNTSHNDCAKSMTQLRDYMSHHAIDESLLSLTANPTACGPNCKLCVENQCLRCVRSVGDWQLGPFTPGVNQPGPSISCENMPAGALVAYSAVGSVGHDVYQIRPQGDFWLDLNLGVTGGVSTYSHNYNQTRAWISTGMYTSGVVPADGKVKAQVYPGTVQAWPVVPGSVVYDTGYTMEIEARELMKELGYSE